MAYCYAVGYFFVPKTSFYAKFEAHSQRRCPKNRGYRYYIAWRLADLNREIRFDTKWQNLPQTLHAGTGIVWMHIDEGDIRSYHILFRKRKWG